MIKLTKFSRRALFGAATVALTGGAFAAGYMNAYWPVVGGAAYCTSFVNGTCSQTVPAGPPLFFGTEYTVMDTGPLGSTTQNNPATVQLQIVQLGQGPYIDQTTVATTQTIPNNTPFFFLDGAQGSALTVTMPPNPIEGQIQKVTCTAATVGVLTIAANTSQTLKNNPAVACVAGVSYTYRFVAANSTWYRI